MYSFGVGNDISFDIAFACMFKMRVKLFDPSPHARIHFDRVKGLVGHGISKAGHDVNASGRTHYWEKIQESPINSTALEMQSIGLGTEAGNLTFYRSKGQSAGSWSLDPSVGVDSMTAPVRTLDQILGGDTPSVVKIDVKGLENDVLKNLMKMQNAAPVIFVDFDSICCCWGDKDVCEKKALEGKDVLKRMATAGYETFEKGEGDFTFWRPTLSR
jgi:FkbM family methyltransferase